MAIRRSELRVLTGLNELQEARLHKAFPTQQGQEYLSEPSSDAFRLQKLNEYSRL
jgi:hypothetical protein